jgi:hypothetical protein
MVIEFVLTNPSGVVISLAVTYLTSFSSIVSLTTSTFSIIPPERLYSRTNIMVAIKDTLHAIVQLLYQISLVQLNFQETKYFIRKHLTLPGFRSMIIYHPLLT